MSVRDILHHLEQVSVRDILHHLEQVYGIQLRASGG
jgi:hypothetical protein